MTPPTALYRYFDDADVLLYVGITDHLPIREYAHIKAAAWMQFAVRSTISRWATRDDALAAERHAIETEFPIFNKQYNGSPAAIARLTEYLDDHGALALLTDGGSQEISFRIGGKPWEVRGPAPTPAPPAMPSWATADVKPNRLIPWWPDDMWCLQWFEHGVASEDELGLLSGLLATRWDALSAIGALAKRRRTLDDDDYEVVTWVQEDLPGTGPTWHRYRNAYSAHADFSHARPWCEDFTDEIAAVQRAFLDLLVTKSRCSAVTYGESAAAFGFSAMDEARVACAILGELARGGTRSARKCMDALALQTPCATWLCPACPLEFLDDAYTRPYCPKCARPTERIDPPDPHADYEFLLREHEAKAVRA